MTLMISHSAVVKFLARVLIFENAIHDIPLSSVSIITSNKRLFLEKATPIHLGTGTPTLPPGGG